MFSCIPNDIVISFIVVSIMYTGQWRMPVPPNAKIDNVSKWECRTSTEDGIFMIIWQIGLLLKTDTSKVNLRELPNLERLITPLPKITKLSTTRERRKKVRNPYSKMAMEG